MRCAIIENGKVVNIVEASVEFAELMGWLPSDVAAIGDIYESGEFVKPLPDPLSAPHTVTMRQARLALLSAGLLDDVSTAIATLPSPQKEAAIIEWEYSQEVQRHNGFVSTLAPILGLDDTALDNLFITAKGL